MSKLPNIPPALRGAVEIFVSELDGHLEFFEKALDNAERQELTEAEFWLKKSRGLTNRFHVLKGASGFLGLTDIRDLAAENEKYFTSLGELSSEGISELRRRLSDLATELREQQSALRAYLAGAATS